jgi:hypothetical protein
VERADSAPDQEGAWYGMGEGSLFKSFLTFSNFTKKDKYPVTHYGK